MGWSLALKDPQRERLQSAFCESEIQENWGSLADESCSYMVYRWQLRKLQRMKDFWESDNDDDSAIQEAKSLNETMAEINEREWDTVKRKINE
jgi:oligoribonuclease NrnB/cAMP/cGMP phosphodiesterase (DHH superfamily)